MSKKKQRKRSRKPVEPKLSLPDSTAKKRRRGIVLALMALVLLAFALRSYRITFQSLWYDEGVSVRLAHMQIGSLLAWTANDIQPPLYYLLLWAWFRLGGPAEPNAVAFWLRFASLFFGVLTVPLLYVMVRKLLGETVAFTAALLMTISPMAVYYGQEGRMYTLLTFAILLSAYILVAILHQPHALKSRQRLWALFAISMAAAMYIHYFSFFFLAALYLYFLFVWWRTGRNPLYLIESIMTAIGAAVLFSPWLPYLFHRYKVDTSYWQGTLKLHEALRHVLIALSLGKTVLEPVGMKLMWGFLALWALGMLVFLAVMFVRKREKTAYPFALLASYQLVPLLSILLLTYRTPKFNPRYLMPVLPAYLAWLAYAAVAPVWNERDRFEASVLGGVISFVAIGFLLLTMGYSLRNLYFDPAFTKPDFRSAANYVRSHFEEGEVVVLCSGHMFPVWNVYAADLPQVRIPDIEVLDTSHPLGYDVAHVLNRKVAGHKGVWLVLWQEDAVDPNGYLMDFMQRYGKPDGKDVDFWHVKVRHFRLDPGVRFSDRPPIQHTLNLRFAGGLSLLGYSQVGDTVTLFWRADAPQPDFRVAYWLEDENRVEWGRGSDRRPAAYEFPAFRWPLGKTIFGKFEIPAKPGTPPGEYDFCLRAYVPGGKTLPVLDRAGAPASDYTCRVSVRLDHVIRGSVHPAHGVGLKVAPGLELLGYDADVSGEVHQGQPLEIELYWKALDDIGADYSIALSMGGSRSIFPMPKGYPTSRWRKGDVVLTRVLYHVPADVEGGERTLSLSLLGPDGRVAGKETPLSKLRIAEARRSFREIPMKRSFGVKFGDVLELVGGEWQRSGGKLKVRLEWKAIRKMGSEWVGFVHGLDASGKLVSQEDKPLLASDGRPTTGWLPGEVVIASYTLDRPDETKTLEIGVYRRTPHGLQRLPAFSRNGKNLGLSFRVGK